MEKQIKTIGVLTSGGDAPGMNAAVRAVVRTGLHKGYRMIGIQRGYNGLINGEVYEMNVRSVSEIILTVSVIVGSQLAYVLNRFKFPGNAFIRNLYTIAALLPAVAMQVTVYQIMSDLHLVNSLAGYIIMSCGTDVISMYIFIQFMENIPISLDESAIIDGANYWQIYWKIMLPLLKPAIVHPL